MATQTEICNRALRKLGANKLTTDIDSTTDNNAIILSDLYDDSLRTVLSAAFWMFATKRADLVIAAGEANDWTKYDLDYIYTLPTDLIRLIGWSEESAIVRQEGEFLLSDVSGLGVLYVWNITDSTEFPPHFTEAFVDKLALDASAIIKQTAKITDMLEERYKTSLRNAKSVDAQGQTPQTPKADQWTNAKHQGLFTVNRYNIFYRS